MSFPLEDFAQVFPWESEEQQKGLRGFMSWWKDLPLAAREHDIACVIAFFVQKNRDAHLWWVDVLATHFAAQRKDTEALQERVRALETKVFPR